ncbi:hypothetical protein MKX07_006410 [Trichoderma sp. CBMAI-0711]|nr:hypothetical protein MKX07_006410 [Trichoderma sp. CBMAI-0711]
MFIFLFGTTTTRSSRTLIAIGELVVRTSISTAAVEPLSVVFPVSALAVMKGIVIAPGARRTVQVSISVAFTIAFAAWWRRRKTTTVSCEKVLCHSRLAMISLALSYRLSPVCLVCIGFWATAAPTTTAAAAAM